MRQPCFNYIHQVNEEKEIRKGGHQVKIQPFKKISQESSEVKFGLTWLLMPLKAVTNPNHRLRALKIFTTKKETSPPN